MGSIGLPQRLASIYNHTVAETLVYPTLAAGATVVSANANWAYGAYATIVPATTILNRFHIHGVVVETCDQNDVFELQLYRSAGDTIVATVRFSVSGGFFGNSVYPLNGALVGANERIRARLACSNGLANQATITMSIVYAEE